MPSEEAQMVIAENGHMVGSGCARDWDRTFEVQPSILERPGQDERVRMNWTDDRSARRQVLGEER